MYTYEETENLIEKLIQTKSPIFEARRKFIAQEVFCGAIIPACTKGYITGFYKMLINTVDYGRIIISYFKELYEDFYNNYEGGYSYICMFGYNYDCNCYELSCNINMREFSFKEFIDMFFIEPRNSSDDLKLYLQLQ